MANKRDLKKEVQFTLSTVIESAILKEEANPDQNKEKAEKIIDETVVAFDDFITRINSKNPENPSTYYKQIRKDLIKTETALLEKIHSM